MSHMHNKSSNKKKNETPKYNKYFDFIKYYFVLQTVKGNLKTNATKDK